AGGNDELVGDGTVLPEALHGGDFLDGGDGDDRLFGQGGNDALDGGAGDYCLRTYGDNDTVKQTWCLRRRSLCSGRAPSGPRRARWVARRGGSWVDLPRRAGHPSSGTLRGPGAGREQSARALDGWRGTNKVGGIT
ncbi:MAG: hypothetical protein AB1725_12120, partial [Armatimonadota bacterium]